MGFLTPYCNLHCITDSITDIGFNSVQSVIFPALAAGGHFSSRFHLYYILLPEIGITKFAHYKLPSPDTTTDLDKKLFIVVHQLEIERVDVMCIDTDSPFDVNTLKHKSKSAVWIQVQQCVVAYKITTMLIHAVVSSSI